MKLILVEDNPVTSMSLSLFFKDKEYKVLDELSYAEDLEVSLKKHSPDVLVMDIMLKGNKNGLEVAKELRESNINIPILFVSALTDSNTIDKFKEITSCDYVSKPYDYEKLIVSLEHLVGIN